MFLHLSVSHSVHTRRGGCLVRGVCSQGECLVRGGVSAPRGLPGPGRSAPGGCLVRGGCGDPPVTATAAGGTHPSGMHSCFL